MTKVCTKCGVEKPLKEFVKNKYHSSGRGSLCLECNALRGRAYRKSKKAGLNNPRKLCAVTHTTKVCGKCNIEKPFSEFYRRRNLPCGYRSTCKSCDNIVDPVASRRYMLKGSYGITVEQYDSLLGQQCGLCAVCGNAEIIKHNITGKIKRLSVDHSHNTGRIRGLLCDRCNRTLGCLEKWGIDPAQLVKYLRKHGD